MRDLRGDLETLWRAAGRLTPVRGGQAIMFMAASEGEGTSSIAASFALMTADRARRSTWLVDLDLVHSSAFGAFEHGFAEGIGKPGRAYDASLGVPSIYEIVGLAPRDASPRNKLLAVHQVQGTRLLVTRFRTDRLGSGERVRLSTRPDWWHALRRAADWVIVDAPSLAASGAGLAMASQMDGVVIVVQSDRTGAQDVLALRAEIEGHGGHVLGIVMNKMAADGALADRLAG